MNLDYHKGVYAMTTAQKWGNSIGVRLPFKLAQKYDIANGTEINVIEGTNEIIIRPANDKPTLDELLSQCAGENPHEEFFSQPIGREDI